MAATPPVCEFGRRAPHFMLPDTDGEIYSLEDCLGANGVLVMFISNRCPYVQAVADKLVREADAMRALGVGVAALNANDALAWPEESFEEMGAFARARGFPFPYLHDASQRAARRYGAVCTPDFFGFNARLELQYRGRLEGAERAGRAPRRELRDAMRLVAETGEGPARQIPSTGSAIKWRETA